MKVIDNLIIGGGLSAIPLLKELDRTGDEYIIINEGKSVWAQLEANDRLDFDLVSSLYTSYFSFELIDMMRNNDKLGDCYPTSSEYYEFLKKYAKIYAPKTIKTRVDKIENHDSFSIVQLSNGTLYKAKNVVVATAFKRKIHHSIKQFNFDENLKGKTIALTSIGDSGNLLIAKLVCFGAKVELLSNGFIALDKQFQTLKYLSKNLTATVDQFEFHNVAKYFPTMYDGTISLGYLLSFLLPRKLSSFLYGPNNFTQAYPLTIRKDLIKKLRKSLINIYLRWIPFVTTSKFPDNSNIAIKYWPIDFYKTTHLHDLENFIKKGFLLNDLPFYIDQGYVDLWDKSNTQINKETQELFSGDRQVKYDFIIEGDRETPALPEILYKNDQGSLEQFHYDYRSTFMGMIAPELNNIYLLGYTRPFTGGLNNITEMQSMFAHKMITQKDFYDSIRTNIFKKIKKYNKQHYLSADKKPSDHLVYYGFYTEKIAELMGIQPKLREARSLKDLAKYFLYPNNPYYYRQKGEYAISGAAELVDKIADEHYYFAGNLYIFLLYLFVFYNIIFFILLLPISLIIKLPIAFAAIIPAHLAATFINGNWGIPNAKRNNLWDYTAHLILLLGLILGSIFGHFLIPLGAVILTHSLSQYLRIKKKSRYVFNDLDSKRDPEATAFFKKYQKIFLKVMKEKNTVQHKNSVLIKEV